MFAARQSFERYLLVQIIRSSVNDGLYVIARQQIAIASREWQASAPFGGLRIGVADGCDLYFRTQPESGNMNAERGSAHADNANAKYRHDQKVYQTCSHSLLAS